MHAAELAARHRQVARDLGAAGEHHSVEVPQLLGADDLLRIIDDAGGH